MVRAVRGQHKLGYLFDPWCAHFPVCSCRCRCWCAAVVKKLKAGEMPRLPGQHESSEDRVQVASPKLLRLSSCVSADAVRRPTQRGSRRLGQGPAFSLPACPQITALTPSATSSRNTLQQATQLPARPALSAAAAAPRPPLGCLPCSCSVAGAGSVRFCADVLCTGMRYGVPIKPGVCASSYAPVLCCQLLQQHAVWCAPHTRCSVLPSAL